MILQIRVGLEFLGNTTVTLRNPQNIEEAGSFSRLSMYIRTTKSDSMLAYVGGDYVPGRPVVQVNTVNWLTCLH